MKFTETATEATTTIATSTETPTTTRRRGDIPDDRIFSGEVVARNGLAV